jgi:hypothetical protein
MGVAGEFQAAFVLQREGDRIMAKNVLELEGRDLLERTLNELANDPSLAVALSDEELAKIVGSAYLKAMRPTKLVAGQTGLTGGEENCGPGSCHPACNSWCHEWSA